MKNPFIAGNWVRGANFLGREQILSEILEGSGHYYWIAGTRRLGKTSLLKQLEYLTSNGEYADNYISLFWNLQGAGDLEGLTESLLESIEDAEERFEALEIFPDSLEDATLLEMLRLLRKKAKQHQKTLLLLCDECEELINIEKHHPEIMPRLRRIFQKGDSIKTVIAATKRLLRLEQSSIPDTSPFLNGFIPPVYLKCFDLDASRQLLARGGFSDAEITEIIEKTNHHPYLMQLLSRRLFEGNDLQTVIREIGNDDMVSHFFAVDFDYLEDTEKMIIWYILIAEEITADELSKKTAIQLESLGTALHSLIQLGYLREKGNSLQIANYFFEKWLKREKEQLFKDSIYRSASGTDATGLPALSGADATSYVGKTLGHYNVLSILGKGGMGTVYKALDTRLERTVALKILAPAMLEESEFRERFLLEAKAASALNHSNIATIFAIEESFGLPFIVMEFIDGITLAKWRQNTEKSVLDRLNVALQIAKGLQCAHQENIVHRDIKPDNLMITADDAVKITDFGLAKMDGSKGPRLTKTGTAMGTLAYMSPEQAAGMEADTRSDIYALGVVFFELFSGELPFQSPNEAAYIYAVIHEQPRKLREVDPDAPAVLETLLLKMLQKNKDDRYQSLMALIADLEAILHSMQKT